MGLGFFAALTQFRFYLPYHLGVLHCVVRVCSDTLLFVPLPHFYTRGAVYCPYFLKVVLPIFSVVFVMVYATKASA